MDQHTLINKPHSLLRIISQAKDSTFTLCLDKEKQRARKGRDLQGWRIHCLDNKKRGEGFKREGFEGKTWTNFVTNTFSPNMERFREKIINLLPFSFPSLPFPSKQTKSTLPSYLSTFLSFPSAFPFGLSFFSLRICYPNIIFMYLSQMH